MNLWQKKKLTSQLYTRLKEKNMLSFCLTFLAMMQTKPAAILKTLKINVYINIYSVLFAKINLENLS